MFKETTVATPEEYIAGLDDPRRSDIQQLHDLIVATAPGLEPHMAYGMIAYGSYHYRSKSGSEGDWMPIALASQKRYISLYVMAADERGYLASSFRERLPKADIGKSCVRIKRLSDVDLETLRALIAEGAAMPRVGEPS